MNLFFFSSSFGKKVRENERSHKIIDYSRRLSRHKTASLQLPRVSFAKLPNIDMLNQVISGVFSGSPAPQFLVKARSLFYSSAVCYQSHICSYLVCQKVPVLPIFRATLTRSFWPSHTALISRRLKEEHFRY